MRHCRCRHTKSKTMNAHGQTHSGQDKQVPRIGSMRIIGPGKQGTWGLHIRIRHRNHHHHRLLDSCRRRACAISTAVGRWRRDLPPVKLPGAANPRAILTGDNIGDIADEPPAHRQDAVAAHRHHVTGPRPRLGKRHITDNVSLSQRRSWPSFTNWDLQHHRVVGTSGAQSPEQWDAWVTAAPLKPSPLPDPTDWDR